MDRAVTRLLRAGAIRDVIVVGAWNNGPLRHSEYMPQAFLPLMPAAQRERLLASTFRLRLVRLWSAAPISGFSRIR